MIRLLLILAICLVTIPVKAQNFPFLSTTPYTYVFKLDSAQVAWVKKNGIKDTLSLFTHKYDSFTQFIPQLSAGYYLFAQYQNRSISAYVHMVPEWKIQILSFNDLVQIKFLDSSYNQVNNIPFWVNQKRIWPDTSCNCFELPRQKKDREFFAGNASRFMLGKIEGEIKQYPSTPNYSYGNSAPNISHGYFLLNQQKFHPKDSLKLKAYILNAQGVAYTKSLHLYLEEISSNKRVLLAKLLPQTRGAYVYQFKLMDTLRIDHMYRLVFETKDGSRLNQAAFSIQEYKLRNNSYEAELEKNKVYKGEEAKIYLTAKDANDLPIPGTKARIRVKLQRYHNFKGSLLFIPNEWYNNMYETFTELDISKRTEVIIPGSTFPPMNLDLLAEISFSDASGELKQIEIPFAITLDSSYHSFNIYENGIWGQYIQLGKSVPKKVVVKGYLNQIHIQTDTLVTPFMQGINPNCNRYVLFDSSGNFMEENGVPNDLLKPRVIGKRTHDSIQIASINPGNFEVHYRIYRDDKLVYKTTARKIQYTFSDTGMASYNVLYSYTQFGVPVIEEVIFTFKEKALTIKTNMPELIYPGQVVPLDIQVLNFERKPQANVNLTAFGVNAQFDDYIDPYLKYYGEYKNKILLKNPGAITPWPNAREGYSFSNVNYTLLLKAGFVSMDDYRLRYPNENIFVYQKKNKQAGIDFTPFVVGNGKRIEIYAIEIDSIPRFVKGLGSNQYPFSFRIEKGMHQIALRTSTAWFYIPNFKFEDSSRYVFSFDTLCLPGGIIKIPQANKMAFSEEEIKRISKHMLVFSRRGFASYKTQTLLLQKNKQQDLESPLFMQYHQGSNQNEYYYGLFAHDTISVVIDGKLVQKLRFEPNKKWVFFRERIIQEEIDSLDIPFEFKFFRANNYEFYSVYDTLPHVMKHQLPLRTFEIQNTNGTKSSLQPNCFFGYEYYSKQMDNSASTLVILSNLHQCKAIAAYFFNIHNSKSSLLLPNLNYESPELNFFLDTGVYKLYVVSENNQLSIQTFQVQTNGTLLIRFDTLDFTYDCAELQKMSETAKMLDILEEMQNRGLVSYRPKDYVQVKTNSVYEVRKSINKLGTLSGYVFDSYGKAIENVILTLENSSEVKGIGFSDVSGGFLMKDIEPGTYALRLTRFGSCVTIIQKVQIKNFQYLDLSIQLQSCGFAKVNGNVVPTLYFGESQITPEIKKQFDNTAEPIIDGLGMVRGRVVAADDKKPLDFVSISIKQNNKTIASTLTDDDGDFIIKNLPAGYVELYANYLGYHNVVIRRIQILPDEIRFVNFSMEENYNSQLQEVVVTYKKDIVSIGGVKGSVSNAPEIMALGTRNINQLATVTYGVESRGGDLPSFRGSRSDGTAYYIDGVRVSSGSVSSPKNAMDVSRDGMKVDDLEKLKLGQRDRLYQMANDPQVKGKRSLFRDYAFWVPNLVTNRYGEAHVTVTFPDNITKWRNFIMAMDESFNTAVYQKDIRSYKPLSASLFLPSYLIKGDEVNIAGKITNYTGDSLLLETSFWNKDTSSIPNKSWVNQYKVEYLKLNATKLDTFQLGYSLKTTFSYEDGEKFLLPIIDNGVEVNAYKYYHLLGDTTILLPELLDGKYSLKILNGYSQLIRDEIKRLQNYRYGCVEQTTSKLNALLLESKLNKLLGDSFTGKEQIIICIKRLEGMQLSNGSWGWYTHSNPEIWLTHYVLQTLQNAALAGYSSKSLARGVKFMQNEFSNLNLSGKLKALEILYNARVDFPYQKHLEEIDESQIDISDRLFVTYLKQKMELPHFSGFLMEGIQKSKEGGIFWKYSNRGIHQNQNTLTLMAYQVLKADLGDSALLAGIRKYFFNDVIFGSNQYRNTLESAKVLQAMAADLSLNSHNHLQTKIELNGNVLPMNYPQEIKLKAGERYTVKKYGAEAMLFFTRKYVDTLPAPNQQRFEIKSQFIQDKNKGDTLKSSVPVNFQVELKVLKETEFLMVQIPIPAGFNYLNRNIRYGADEAEYHNDRIILYYRKLPAGNRQISIQLEPRFTGNFRLLPVQVENMYDPSESGNNSIRMIRVVD